MTRHISGVERPLHLFALSAASESALLDLARRYHTYLVTSPVQSLADVCSTVNTSQPPGGHRLVLSAAEMPGLCQQLQALVAGEQWPSLLRGRVREGHQPKVAFLFSGMGGEYVHMGRSLYNTQPTFREVFDRCAALAQPSLEQPLQSVLYPEARVEAPLHEPTYVAAAGFTLEYALTQMWRSWGIEPDVVMGHSVGGYVAACVAGWFSVADGVHLTMTCGRLLQAWTHGGMMVAVFADEARVATVLAPYQAHVTIAAVNGPQNTLIAGPQEAVQMVRKEFECAGIATRLLPNAYAVHSPMMEPEVMQGLADVVSQMHVAAPQIPFVSSLTGQLVAPGVMPEAPYWSQSVRAPVRFADGIRTLVAHGCELFLEIGPHTTLLTLGQDCHASSPGSWLPSLRRGHDAWHVVLASLGTLYTRGVDVSWTGFDQDYRRYTTDVSLSPPAEATAHVALQQARWRDAPSRPPLPVRPSHEGEVTRAALRTMPPQARLPRILTYLQDHVAWLAQCRPHQLDVYQPLDAVGLDSLLVIELAGRIQRDLGVILPIHDFVHAPSLMQLATIVLDRLQLRSQDGVSVRDALLVPLQPTGTQRPFFCVTAGYGGLLALRHLAQYLAPDQPFYGLQPPSRLLPAVVLPWITDLAASYIDALRTIQPAGPYCLGGYSAGGLVAFEMAQQLWQQGQRVCLL